MGSNDEPSKSIHSMGDTTRHEASEGTELTAKKSTVSVWGGKSKGAIITLPMSFDFSSLAQINWDPITCRNF